MENKHQSLEQSFVQRVRSFAEWLAERTPSQQGVSHERLASPSSNLSNGAVYSSSPNRTSESLDSAYELIAGLIFHKILERSSRALPTLESRPWLCKVDFEEAVLRAFSLAGSLAPGFTPLFQSAAEAVNIIPDTQPILAGIRAFLKELEAFPLENIELSTVGTILESLIPRVERHQRGQFYTPASIAEILVQWAVRRPTDQVLDPACGAGIILTRAYAQLCDLEIRDSSHSLETACNGNGSSRLHGFDIDSAAVRLAAASIAMQGVDRPAEAARFTIEDFFKVSPLDPHAGVESRTGEGEVYCQGVSIPLVDAVVTNPPYTRWSELPRRVRGEIQEKLRDTLRAYHLLPTGGWGVEAGLHVYFTLWAHRFLRPGGRLAMIVSDSWLQTDFGTAFGRFLLDHFRVCAVVDLGARVFSAPIVGACLLFLEREDDLTARAANMTRFVLLEGANEGQRFDAENMLRVVNGLQSHSPRLSVREVTQGRVPRGSKWIQNFFNVGECLESLQRSPLMIRLERLCDVAYGNATYLVLTSKGVIRGVPNVGGEQFFHLSDHDAHTWRLSPPWLHPLLPSGRYAPFYRFTKTDWESLQSQGARCWLFTAHPSQNLPPAVSEYIHHGERTVKLRRMKRSNETAKTVSDSFASSVRRRHPQYFEGWFDLGGTEPAPIFAIRGVQYRPRFALADFPVALDDRLMALIPKTTFDNQHLKALVASLNSTLIQFQIEATCRSTGGGMVELDLRHTGALLTLDVTQLSSEQVATLASSFEKLEEETRQLGGAESRTQLDALTPLFNNIDAELAEIAGLSGPELRCMQELAGKLVERRLSRVTTPLVV